MTAWREWWQVGGLWRALLAAIAYWLVFRGIGWLVTTMGVEKSRADPLGGARYVVLDLALPVAIMGVVTLVFVRSLGWGREIFGVQPLGVRRGQWVGLVLVAVVLVARFAVVDYSLMNPRVVGALAVYAMCVGFAEGLVFRGIVVACLRRGGDRERDVAWGSAAIFALVHVGNVVGVDGLEPIDGLGVIGQVIFAFGAGVVLFVAMVTTRLIIWSMVLHAGIDLAGFLVAAQADVAFEMDGAPVILMLAFGFLIPVLGVVLLFLVDGRVGRERYGLPALTSAIPR
ncbi:CPBP family intramembrane glutamic endopeptidase [Demequina sp. NBRC 110055]|uniref:CPBP family intramembrane glutamic endopeptidase n=1 Tax=Demequina sp. NBRC 110055 TaxID=1570344 RepID=UPI000A072F8D|nr:CPBP family intramembrane glutamic endopeptidase [Demequina sp. NBRC 110055]